MKKRTGRPTSSSSTPLRLSARRNSSEEEAVVVVLEKPKGVGRKKMREKELNLVTEVADVSILSLIKTVVEYFGLSKD